MTIRPYLRIFLLVLTAGVSILQAEVAPFKETGTFESVDAFMASAKKFKPAGEKSDLSALFATPEIGQPDDPRTGRAVYAASIESCVVLWSGESDALVFVQAAPPTEATKSVVGVLFLLHHTGSQWSIADHLKFTAAGKYSEVSAKQTAEAGTGYELGREGMMMPVVTVTESRGGRGFAYLVSASFTIHQSRLKPLPLD